MLVTPYDQIEKLWEEAFWQVTSVGVGVAVQTLSTKSFIAPWGLLVLMNAHEVEPVFLLCARLEELDLSISECSEKTLVPHITHAV